MEHFEALELIRQLRTWVDKTLSSLTDIPLAEARVRYRKVTNVMAQINDLHMPIPEDIRAEKETLEELISMSSERDKLVSLAKELSSLARDINHRLRGTQSSVTPLGGKAPPKILRVTFSDGKVICERTASSTFIRTLQHIGLERVAELRSIRRYGHPIVSNRRNESGGMIHEVDGFYVETRTATKDKATLLERIEQELGIGISVEMINV